MLLSSFQPFRKELCLSQRFLKHKLTAFVFGVVRSVSVIIRVLTSGQIDVGVCGEEPGRTETVQHTRQEVVLPTAGLGNVKRVRWQEEKMHGTLYRNKCRPTNNVQIHLH